MILDNQAFNRLIDAGIHPSAQRIAIMEYLLTNFTHPTVDEIYKNLCPKIPTLSKTTVYNTLRLFAEHHAAQMITIDDHRVCYDGKMEPHVHFFCNKCGKIIDLPNEAAPQLAEKRNIDGHIVDEMQLYYKGVCNECVNAEMEKSKN